jgi:hypothetical protein
MLGECEMGNRTDEGQAERSVWSPSLPPALAFIDSGVMLPLRGGKEEEG